MKWYVIHTKAREEFRALENLQNQGFEVLHLSEQIEYLDFATPKQVLQHLKYF
jgi:hypothetical protein